MARLDIFNRKKEQVKEEVIAQPVSEGVAQIPEEVFVPIEEDIQSPELPIDDADVDEKEVEEEEVVEDRPAFSEPVSAEPINGWMPIETASLNGMPIKLSLEPNGDGVVGFWKKTRAFANATKRYEPYGKWVDFMTGMDIGFTPKFWKDRYAV